MNFIYRSKLFKQMVGIIALLVIMAIGIPGAFYLYYTTPKMVEERYHQVMISNVEFLADRLDWHLAKGFADLAYLSERISLTDSAKVQEAEEILDIFIRGSSIFTGGLATNRDGILLLFYSSPHGIIKLKQKNDISDRDYIKIPLENNKKYLSDVFITKSNPSPVIFLSSSVVKDGQTTGILALSINLWNQDNIFRALFQGFQEKLHSNIYVVDGQGTIIFHRDKDMIGKTLNSSILTKLADNNEGVLEQIKSEEENIALAFSKLQNINWVVVQEMTHNEIYAMSKVGSYMTLLTMALLLLLGLFASAIFAGIVLKPLAVITRATAKVAAGDLDQQIDYARNNDFREVILNFNVMTSNLRAQYDQHEKLSLQDYLTGLANRRYMEQQLKLELERAYRLGHPSAILMLDIDDFKRINDKFGHLTGDKVLQFLASDLKEAVREIDLPTRFGGEEFLILLPETSLDQGRMVAEKIRERISRLIIPSRRGSISFTVSIGIACTEQDGIFDGDDLNKAYKTLVYYADQALYKAKSKGKNRVEVYEIQS